MTGEWARGKPGTRIGERKSMIENEEERARYMLCQLEKDEGRRDELSARRRLWEHVLEGRDMRGRGAV